MRLVGGPYIGLAMVMVLIRLVTLVMEYHLIFYNGTPLVIKATFFFKPLRVEFLTTVHKTKPKKLHSSD